MNIKNVEKDDWMYRYNGKWFNIYLGSANTWEITRFDREEVIAFNNPDQLHNYSTLSSDNSLEITKQEYNNIIQSFLNEYPEVNL